MDIVTLQEHYGFVEAGRDYPVLQEGYDFLKIKYQGKGVYIPKSCAEKSKRRQAYEPLPTYEDIISEEEI